MKTYDAVFFSADKMSLGYSCCREISSETRRLRGTRFGWRRSVVHGGIEFPACTIFITPNEFGSAAVMGVKFFSWEKIEDGCFGGTINEQGLAAMDAAHNQDVADTDAVRKTIATEEHVNDNKKLDADVRAAMRCYLEAVAILAGVRNLESVSSEQLLTIAMIADVSVKVSLSEFLKSNVDAPSDTPQNSATDLSPLPWQDFELAASQVLSQAVATREKCVVKK